LRSLRRITPLNLCENSPGKTISKRRFSERLSQKREARDGATTVVQSQLSTLHRTTTKAFPKVAAKIIQTQDSPPLTLETFNFENQVCHISPNNQFLSFF